VHEPFVGRTTELAELNRQFALAAGGQGRAVLLAGPAGIGKTAMIRRAMSGWTPRARAVLASGDPEEAAMPGGLLSQLTRSASASAADMAAVLASGRPDPLRAGSALLALVHELASVHPLVIVIDDAQWGDELSLKSLSFAVRRLNTDPVLCVIAVRCDDLLRLPSGITKTADEHGARLDLDGLDTTEVAALAELAGAGSLPGRAARRLRDHTAGNPLHVRELLHDLPGELLRTPDISLAAPRSLETLVLSRLAGCTLETERLVVAAAVLGTDCELADAAALAGLADPLPAWQEAIEQRLLSEPETTGQRRCAFPHVLIRTAIYRDVGVSRRAALHRLAADLTGGCTALAHRTAGCRGSDPQLAADLARQAAAERSASQLADAAEHLLMAARVASRGPDADQHLLTAVEMLIDLGDAARAGAYADEVRKLTPSALRSLLLGRLAMAGGDYAAAERWIAAVWAALRTETPADQEQVRHSASSTAGQLALMLSGQDRMDDAAAWAQRSAEVAASGFGRACPCAVRAGALAASGQAARASALLNAELRQQEDGAGRTLLQAATGAVLLFTDDLQGAIRHLDAAVAADGDASLPMTQRLEAALLRVHALYRCGEWDLAAAEGERLVTLVDDLGQRWLLAGAHLAAVHVAAGRGNWLTATSHAEAAARELPARGRAGVIALADAQVAIAVARDDTEGVLAAVGRSACELGSLSQLEPGKLTFLAACAQALARTGRHEEASIVLRWYEERGTACGRRSAMAAACRARGVIEAASNCPDRALAAFDASMAHLNGLGMPLEEALTRLERGRLLRRLGQRRSAAREIGTARTLFAGLDAQPYVLRCNSELYADPEAVTDAARPPLTPRQLSVAQAAAEGKSNRVIAAELYISVKTVEFHIAQILARLALDSRTQIATALAADGIASPAGVRNLARDTRIRADLPA
jgi:ATP/maltotriose-dependent transcriptional regulator MalT